MLIISFNQIKLQKLHIPVPLYNHYYNYHHFQIKDVYLRYNHNHLELNVIYNFQLDFLLLLYLSIQSEAHNLHDDKLLCEPNEKDGRFLFDEIIKSGNFGKSSKELSEKKSSSYGHLWLFFIRNLRYWRFDKWDWICGPLWRIYYKFWKLKRGFE